MLKDLNKLLIVRLRNLGDCVLMTPVLETLRQWRPNLEITVLVERPFSAAFSNNPHISRLEVLDRPAGPLGTYRCRAAILRRLRQSSFDLVWNLHGGSTSLLMSLAPRSRMQMGFEHFRQAHRYSLRAPSAAGIWAKDPVHTVETQLAPLKWLGVPIAESAVRPRVYVSPEALQQADTFLERCGLAGRPFVLVQPTATLRTKQWPEDRFCRLLRLIRARCGLDVVLSAGPGEEAVAQRVAQGFDPQVARVLGWGLEELKALMSRCSYFIGNDSGPMHLAAALQRPLVAIFGSSNYNAWHPWGTDYEAVRADLPCVPCPGYRCYEFDTPRCIEGLRADAVFSAFERLAARHPWPSAAAGQES